MGKRTAQKDTIIDITSDSQVNSNFPNRWSPASKTFNNYFYLFLYLYITWITINNNAPHLKSPKNQNRRAALGRPAIKIIGGLQLVCGRPTLALSSALVPQTLSCSVCVHSYWMQKNCLTNCHNLFLQRAVPLLEINTIDASQHRSLRIYKISASLDQNFRRCYQETTMLKNISKGL